MSPPPPSTARPATSPGPRPRCAPGTSARSSWSAPARGRSTPTLAARGYALRDPTLLLAAPVSGLASPPGLDAIPCDRPLAAMAAIWAAGGIGPARLAVMARAPAPPPISSAASATARPARASWRSHGDTAMLHALEVSPAARRRGLGAADDPGRGRLGARRGAPPRSRSRSPAPMPRRSRLYAALGLTEASALSLPHRPGGRLMTEVTALDLPQVEPLPEPTQAYFDKCVEKLGIVPERAARLRPRHRQARRLRGNVQRADARAPRASRSWNAR